MVAKVVQAVSTLLLMAAIVTGVFVVMLAAAHLDMHV